MSQLAALSLAPARSPVAGLSNLLSLLQTGQGGGGDSGSTTSDASLLSVSLSFVVVSPLNAAAVSASVSLMCALEASVAAAAGVAVDAVTITLVVDLSTALVPVGSAVTPAAAGEAGGAGCPVRRQLQAPILVTGGAASPSPTGSSTCASPALVSQAGTCGLSDPDAALLASLSARLAGLSAVQVTVRISAYARACAVSNFGLDGATSALSSLSLSVAPASAAGLPLGALQGAAQNASLANANLYLPGSAQHAAAVQLAAALAGLHTPGASATSTSAFISLMQVCVAPASASTTSKPTGAGDSSSLIPIVAGAAGGTVALVAGMFMVLRRRSRAAQRARAHKARMAAQDSRRPRPRPNGLEKDKAAASARSIVPPARAGSASWKLSSWDVEAKEVSNPVPASAGVGRIRPGEARRLDSSAVPVRPRDDPRSGSAGKASGYPQRVLAADGGGSGEIEPSDDGELHYTRAAGGGVVEERRGAAVRRGRPEIGLLGAAAGVSPQLGNGKRIYVTPAGRLDGGDEANVDGAGSGQGEGGSKPWAGRRPDRRDDLTGRSREDFLRARGRTRQEFGPAIARDSDLLAQTSSGSASRHGATRGVSDAVALKRAMSKYSASQEREGRRQPGEGADYPSSGGASGSPLALNPLRGGGYEDTTTISRGAAEVPATDRGRLITVASHAVMPGAKPQTAARRGRGGGAGLVTNPLEATGRGGTAGLPTAMPGRGAAAAAAAVNQQRRRYVGERHAAEAEAGHRSAEGADSWSNPLRDY